MVFNAYDYLKSKGYKVEKRWQKITIGELIELLREYSYLKTKENGGTKKRPDKSS